MASSGSEEEDFDLGGLLGSVVVVPSPHGHTSPGSCRRQGGNRSPSPGGSAPVVVRYSMASTPLAAGPGDVSRAPMANPYGTRATGRGDMLMKREGTPGRDNQANLKVRLPPPPPARDLESGARHRMLDHASLAGDGSEGEGDGSEGEGEGEDEGLLGLSKGAAVTPSQAPTPTPSLGAQTGVHGVEARPAPRCGRCAAKVLLAVIAGIITAAVAVLWLQPGTISQAITCDLLPLHQRGWLGADGGVAPLWSDAHHVLLPAPAHLEYHGRQGQGQGVVLSLRDQLQVTLLGSTSLPPAVTKVVTAAASRCGNVCPCPRMPPPHTHTHTLTHTHSPAHPRTESYASAAVLTHHVPLGAP